MAELAGRLFSSEATPAKNVSSYGLAEWVWDRNIFQNGERQTGRSYPDGVQLC